MNLKKIVILFVFVFSALSLFALDSKEYFSSTALSDDGEFMCIATVHVHEFVEGKDGKYVDPDPTCPDINKESIWIAATRNWWIHPGMRITFKNPGWSHPAVCYDKYNDAFLVFHCSKIASENGFYEIYNKSSKYTFKKFTKLDISREAGIFVTNDTGIYFIQDQNLAWATNGDWFDTKNHCSIIYKLDTTNRTVKTLSIKPLDVIKIMGVPLELDQKYGSIQDIEPVFATKNGLIIRDYDRKTWWYYNCLDDSVKHFYSKEEVQNYDAELEHKRLIDALMPELEAKLEAENKENNLNQSEVISQAISESLSKALAEILPDALPSTISSTITDAVAAAIPAVSGSENSDEADAVLTETESDITQTDAAAEVGQTQENPKWYVILIIVFLVLVLVSAAVIIILLAKRKKGNSLKNTNRLEVSRLVYDTQEQERASVSRDIHDSVVQDMRGIRLETELLHVNEDSVSRQKKIEDMATDCVVKLRNICYNLTPAELTTNSKGTSSKFELVSIIQTLAQQFTERTKLPCAVKVDDGFKYSTYSKEVSLNVFRVVQEALNNIEKHSYATKASIFMQSDGKKMKIFITDDGVGFDTNVVQQHDDGLIHFGLQMMKDRMDLIGGTIKFISGDNDGTEIQLEFGE